MSEQRPITLVDSRYGPLYTFENDLVTKQMREYGAHTRNEIAFLLSVIDEGDNVIDLGGHIGTFAIPLAKAAGPDGKVVSVEPDAANHALLARNISLNELNGKCMGVRCLVSESDGIYSSVTPHKTNTAATYFSKIAETQQAVGDWKMHPPVFTLDQIAAAFFSRKTVNVVKIDVEGMEVSALRSGENLIRSDRPILYIEIAKVTLERKGQSIEAIEEFLSRYDYRFFKNIGERNSDTDFFEPAELVQLTDGGEFFDVLAIPQEHPRINRVT